ncbi:hypothetical protein PV08_03281 [Exophiala spinifera]|uniref:Piwi domain-containing protein n=1 Tax=Exophiala spinifera TaxID=91928 RepID=A0A0D1YUR6_9EURO|nr:uncharacterized protein PV08_03281 [Exophiala spinifera]KIW18991.1 hypothetical protein PV08_03281 [Exophiala spinifera]
MDARGRGRGRSRGNRGNYDTQGNQGNFGRRGSSGYRDTSANRGRSGSRGGYNSRGGFYQSSDRAPSTGFGHHGSQAALEQSMSQLSVHSDTDLLANHFEVTIGKYAELYRYALSFRKRPQGDTGDCGGKDLERITKSKASTESEGNTKVGVKSQGDPVKESASEPKSFDKDGKSKSANPPDDDDNGDEPTHASETFDSRINRSKTRRIIALLILELKADKKLARIPLATNYSTHIITASPILEKISKIFTIDYYDEYRSGPPDNPEVFDVKLVFEKSFSLRDLSQHLQESSRTQSFVEFPDKEDAVSALNIIFSYHPYVRCFPTFTHENPPRFSERFLTTVGARVFYGVYVRGRNGPTDTGQIKQQGPLNSIPGFSRSVRTGFSADVPINLNINTKTSLFYAKGNVQELIDAWKTQNAPRQWHQYHYADLAKFLKGLSVRTLHLTDHQEPDNFLATITNLARVSQDGMQPTVAAVRADNPGHQHMESLGAYFDRVHNTHYGPKSNVFAVVIGGGDCAKAFPADLLDIIPGQVMRKTRELPLAAVQPPDENKKRILDKGRSLFYGSNPSNTGARQFDLSLGDVMISVPVVPLAAPVVRYRRIGNAQNSGPPPENHVWGDLVKYGSWNLKDSSYFRPAAQRFVWTYIELTLKNSGSVCRAEDLSRFSQGLQSALHRVGMVGAYLQALPFPEGHKRELPHETLPTQHHVAGLVAQFNFIDEMIRNLRDKHGVNLIVFLLPTKDMELYSAVKRVGDQRTGVATVCHVLKYDRWKKHYGPNTSPDFYGNLSMKINLKMNSRSVNQSLAVKPAILGAGTMILGIDVTHAGALAMSGAPSIAAVVGSVDAEFSQWPASLRENPLVQDQDGKKKSNEQVTDLKDMVMERLRGYYDANKQQLPQRILVYRDGLSEGQFKICEEQELPQITAAIEAVFTEKGRALSQGQSIPVALICAVKRHHTRFFPTSDVQQDTPTLIGYGAPGKKSSRYNFNPMPGTMVTEKVTYGKGQDFFLISQKAQIGTARPTHYVILKNSTIHTRDDIALATHHLCFLFGRSTGSVSVCPAAYYADLAADRARFYVRRFYNAAKDEKWDPAAHQDHRFDLSIHESMRERMFYI